MDIRFAEWVLARGRRELLRGDEVVALTTKAYQLLDLMVEKRPNVVTKSEIYERLWPSTFVSEVNLSRLVFEIRRALRDDARRPQWVRTVRGYGYAFSGSVTEVARAPSTVESPQGSCRLILADREVVLAEGENVLGRSRATAVWLDSTSVSRRHACIVVTGGTAILEDLGSKNGTFKGGTPITAATALADGDEIRIGTVRAMFRIVPPEDSTTTTY